MIGTGAARHRPGVALPAVGQRADHDVPAGRRTPAWGISLILPPKNMLRNSVLMMSSRVAQGDLGRAQFAGDAIENAAAQPRTQPIAGGLGPGNHALDDGIGVRFSM